MDGQQPLLLRALRGEGSPRDGNALAVLGLGGGGWVEQGEHPVSASATSTAPEHGANVLGILGCPCLVLLHSRAHPEPHSSPSVPSPAKPGLKLELEVLQIHHSLLTFLQGALSFPSLTQVIQALPIWAPLPWGLHPGHGMVALLLHLG